MDWFDVVNIVIGSAWAVALIIALVLWVLAQSRKRKNNARSAEAIYGCSYKELMAGSEWRVGRKVGRTIYRVVGTKPSDRDDLIGMLDTAWLAQMAVDAHNDSAHGRRLQSVKAALNELDNDRGVS